MAQLAATRCERSDAGVLETPTLRRLVRIPRMPASEFVDGGRCGATFQAARETNRLQDKIVFLGTSFSASRDFVLTPLGRQNGTEVLAMALEQELHGAGSRRMSWEKYAGKALIGLLVVAIHAAFRPVPALFLTVGLIAGLVWKGPFLAARLAGYRASSVPFALGILLEQMTSSSERAQHLEAENSRLEEELRELSAKLPDSETRKRKGDPKAESCTSRRPSRECFLTGSRVALGPDFGGNPGNSRKAGTSEAFEMPSPGTAGPVSSHGFSELS